MLTIESCDNIDSGSYSCKVGDWATTGKFTVTESMYYFNLWGISLEILLVICDHILGLSSITFCSTVVRIWQPYCNFHYILMMSTFSEVHDSDHLTSDRFHL